MLLAGDRSGGISRSRSLVTSYGEEGGEYQ